jgi:outer membrane immunogenic protein
MRRVMRRVMRNTSLTVAAIGLLASQASAADLNRPAYVYKAVPPPVPVFTWTGFYVGGNAGYAWSDASTFPLTGTQGIPPPAGVGILSAQNLGIYPFTSSVGQNGAIGGFQAGYNWQFNWLVTGIEADFDFASQRGSSNFAGSTTVFSDAASISRSLDDLGTLRARIGFAADRTLFYATGGLAYGLSKLGYSAAISNPPNNAGLGSNATSTWQAGWTVGGGIEYALWDHWSVKAEYLYYDLGTQSTTIVGVPAPGGTLFNNWTATTTVRNNGNIVRAGLNYKF